jgi:hypothetical protein
MKVKAHKDSVEKLITLLETFDFITPKRKTFLILRSVTTVHCPKPFCIPVPFHTKGTNAGQHQI